MITYKKDENKSYDETIKHILRSHNAQFWNSANSKDINLYAFNGKELVGAIEANYFWDWVSIEKVFYHSIDILKQMIERVWYEYQNQAVSMAYFTTVTSRCNDFLEVGFVLENQVELDENTIYYYTHYNNLNAFEQGNLSIMFSEEKNTEYHDILDQQHHLYNEKHRVEDVSDVFDIAVFDQDAYIGGMQSNRYGSVLYIDRLAVDIKYRHQQIGTTLMNYAIDEARSLGLSYVMLGTTSFQAKAFYEKLGFQVVNKKDNVPRGYQSYSMSLKL